MTTTDRRRKPGGLAPGGTRRYRERHHWPVQLAGAATVASAAWCAPWMLLHLNLSDALGSIPFACGLIFMVIQISVNIINNWHWKSPEVLLAAAGYEPYVGIIVPTCGEPVIMVYRTLISVISQDWPIERMILVLSDDAPSGSMARMVRSLNRNYPKLTIHYHTPPSRGSADRRGEAKAGNLNSALDCLRVKFPFVEFIETRDADDLVGDPSFLRRTVGTILDDDSIAFVQTIKESAVSSGDPFNNQESLFYRGIMQGRHSANAVFPCGSGLLWRRSALEDIGDFPSWNLVEDLQSGVEALKRGWRGSYVPIVGARAQHSPEDLANVIKQRGTWALDTVRLLVWRSLRGMTLRQRLQFLEMGMFYFQGFALLTLWVTAIIFALQDKQPVVASRADYMMHFLPYILSVEVLLAVTSWAVKTENTLAVRRLWHGLMFVYMKAAFLALLYGPNRKPTYRVTRKNNVTRWYWKETVPHAVFLCIVAATAGYLAGVHGVTDILHPDTLYWLAVTSFAFGSFIPLGWYGVDFRTAIRNRLRRRRLPDVTEDGPVFLPGQANALNAAGTASALAVLASLASEQPAGFPNDSIPVPRRRHAVRAAQTASALQVLASLSLRQSAAWADDPVPATLAGDTAVAASAGLSRAGGRGGGGRAGGAHRHSETPPRAGGQGAGGSRTPRRRPVLRTSAGLAALFLIAYGVWRWSAPPAPHLNSAATLVPAQAAARPGQWVTVWNDSFNGPAGSGVSPKYWKYDTGRGRFGTAEIETMTSSTRNVHLDGHGDLKITALGSGSSWTSGRIQTKSFGFGAPPGGMLRVTASLRQPSPHNGIGYWPAFWMIGPGLWPATGEIDIMEDVDALSMHSASFHCGNMTQRNPDHTSGPCHEHTGLTSHLLPCKECQSGYHTYTVIIDRRNPAAEQIRWYLDGRQFFAVNESQVGRAVWDRAVNHGFSIIFSLSLGGEYPDVMCHCHSPVGQTSSGGTMSIRDVSVAVQTAPRNGRA